VWQSIRQRLGPGGRVMANLGHPPGMAGAKPAHAGRTLAALEAMAEAFEGEWLHVVRGGGRWASWLCLMAGLSCYLCTLQPLGQR
jgi:hypothetical protein